MEPLAVHSVLEPGLAAWTDAIARHVTPAALRERASSLPAPRSRLHHPSAMADAERQILAALEECRWQTERHAFRWPAILGVLDYPIGTYGAGEKLKLYRDLEGANLFAIKAGQDSTAAIVVSAHFDTVRDSPGADDNTASVAALLELARLLTPYRFRDTIILAAFDMEEIGLLGSQAGVPVLAAARPIREAIVFETMGYYSDQPHSQAVPRGLGALYPSAMRRISQRGFKGDWTMIIHRADSRPLANALCRSLERTVSADAALALRDPTDFPVIGRLLRRMQLAQDFTRGDHASFWQAGIPAITVTDTANYRNPNYHLASDTSDTVNWERVATIVIATASVLAQRAGLLR
jgi:Zn-dependent M28 family amino/carboxypeptidase